MPFLSADDILKKDSYRYDTIDVPEWEGTLRFRTISGADRDRWAAYYARAQQTDEPTAIVGAQARLIALAACDDSGCRIFTDEQIEVLNEGQSGAVIFKVYKAIAKLNKIDDEAVAEEGKDSSALSSGTDSDSVSS